MEIDKLLLKLNLGKNLQQEEIAEVIDFLTKLDLEELANSNYFDDIYTHILVLGRAKNIDNKYLLEKFLELKDPTLSCLIIEILCLEWQQTEEYLERILDFALGVSWDLDEDLRHSAFKALASYLRSKIYNEETHKMNSNFSEKEKQILEVLLGFVKDKELEKTTRIKAYLALCQAIGLPDEEIPSENELLKLKKFPEDLKQNILLQVEKLSHSSLLN